VHANDDDRLPAVIERYVDRAVSLDGPLPRQVLIVQTGEMFRRPNARTMRFTATERFAVDRVAFSWEARFRIAPLLSLNVRDGYAHGRGMLNVRALGFSLQTQSGPNIDVGEAYRYLAELPWMPYAIAVNRELEWRQVDDLTVDVATRVRDERATVRIEFDEEGDIVRVFADARPRESDGRSVATRWGGELSQYRTLGGMRMPAYGEVYWDLAEGRFVYWRGQITAAQALAEPFERP